MAEFTAPDTYDSSAAARGLTRDGDPSQSQTAGRLALVLGFWAAVALLYWPSAVDLSRLWTNWAAETYTHGYLVFLLSIWLIVRDRQRLALTPVRSEPLALIPLLLMSAAWIWLWRAAIQELQLLLLPLVLYSALFAAFGRRMARALAFPIGFLYFAMPLWGDINVIVQDLSAKITGVLIWVTGIPAYMTGNMAYLPGGTIEIAESCSGLHTLIVGLALAALYGKVSGEPWRRRLAWIASMGAISLIVNWVRIFTVIVAAYETDMRTSLVRNHYWLGWWLFAFAFAGFLWWTGRRSAARHPGSTSNANQLADRSPSGIGPAPVLVTLAALAVMPAFAYGMDWANAAGGGRIEVQWPTAPAGWTGPSLASGSEWKPYFVNPSGESLTRYADSSSQPIEAFAVAYRVQTQRAKLLSYWNRLLGHAGDMRQQSARVVNSPAGRWREILVADPSGSRSLIWTRYRVGNRLFVEPRTSQLWYGLAAVVKPPVSSLTALRTPCLPDCNAARARLGSAAQWLQPALR